MGILPSAVRPGAVRQCTCDSDAIFACYFDLFVEVLKRKAVIALSNKPGDLQESFMIDPSNSNVLPAISRYWPFLPAVLLREVVGWC
jgi:hypothetical protein